MESLSQKDACIILDLVEAATEDHWPATAEAMLEKGYSGAEVQGAFERLSNIAWRRCLIKAGDF